MNFHEISWTVETPFPLLGGMQLLPALVGGVLFFVRSPRIALGLGLAAVLSEIALGYELYQYFKHLDHAGTTFHLVEQLSLGGPLVYHVGADGLTVLFMLLTAFLSLMVLLYGAKVRQFTPLQRFLSIALFTESALMMQFATLDLLWFSLTSAVQIPLIGFLLRSWATSTSAEAGAVTRYYQFMGLGLSLLLVATLLLGWNHASLMQGTWCFDLPSLAQTPAPPWAQSILFYLLLYGLAIRIPLFPLHGWLPDVAEHGTVAAAMVLLIGLKSGIYGLLRYLFTLLPEGVWQWHAYVVAFATVGIFYAAVLAILQRNVRRLLAYAVVSHTGVMTIGLFSLLPKGFQGCTLLAINFGLAISAILLVVGSIYLRTRTLLLDNLGGLYDRMPLLAAAFLVATLAILGMPMTPGFDAVHLLLEAAIDRFGTLVTITAALGNVAAASCLLWAFQRAFLGTPVSPTPTKTMQRERIVEKTMVLMMIVVQLSVGFYSGPGMKLIDGYTHALAVPYQGRKP